jgi:hypothetical protein
MCDLPRNSHQGGSRADAKIAGLTSTRCSMRLLTIVGGVREARWCRRGRGKTICARGSNPPPVRGPSTSPLEAARCAFVCTPFPPCLASLCTHAQTLCRQSHRDSRFPPGPTPEFTTRLRERFPAGSSVQALLDELRAERFTISGDPHRSTATYEITGFPCRDTWTIEWVAENQKISSITGEALAICL